MLFGKCFYFRHKKSPVLYQFFLSLPQVNRLKKQRPIFFNENLSESAPKKKGYKKKPFKTNGRKGLIIRAQLFQISKHELTPKLF